MADIQQMGYLWASYDSTDAKFITVHNWLAYWHNWHVHIQIQACFVLSGKLVCIYV